MSDKDGGAAFPMFFQGDGQVADAANIGMALRDWFAGQALSGVMATLPHMATDTRSDVARFAHDCYLMADAMLAERAK